ncbi:hypothetical protein GCM10010503_38950 [Streptomyces lucensis JCM 4490]|uniref:Ester cyclase n=1 Tax=Streptomyces lucensis JCM 4490 TaxID=1306176 RepID=A0A918J928_9ACTN|nr:ester cyclase [Streptomyces lucensis]GGW58132.1 hypothetical protein GCM10010503_38950 [Streptomyces lucensis JCM 4490]
MTKSPTQDQELTAEELANLTAVSDVLPHWNAHNIKGVLGFYQPDITWHNVAMEATYHNRREVGAFLNNLFAAFPDLTFEVGERIARGDRVAEKWTMAGTHLGTYLGVPATGRRVEIHGMSMVRMREGRFLTDDFYYDASGVMRQLGLLPSLQATTGRAGRAILTLAVITRKVAVRAASVFPKRKGGTP